MTEKLVSFTTCPYVQRALLVVREKGVEVEIEYIDPDDRPDWFWDKSPRGKVPLLLVGEAALFESQAICEYLEEAHPEPALMPRDLLERARDRAWFGFAGDELFVPLYKMVTSSSPTRFERAKDELEAGLAKLQKEKGSKPWLSGDGSRFGMADVAVAPIFSRLALLEKLGAYRLPGSLDDIRDWGERILARPAMQAAIPEAFEADLLAKMRAQGSVALDG
jgi:glutathione S-transferase